MLIKYYLTHLKSLSCIFLLLFPLVVTATEGATEDEVAEAVRAWFSAWNSWDIKAIVKLDGNAVGFGYRSAPWRDASALGEEAYRQILKQMMDRGEYSNMDLEELHTSVEGDVGLAWGIQMDDFKAKGQSPEKARVRFTMVLKKSAEGWSILLYHRDIQPFDEQGRYLREHTMLSHDN